MNLDKIKNFFSQYKYEILLVISFILWMKVFDKFLILKACFGEDTRYFIPRFKFFLDNIVRGVYPLWNPFSYWGTRADLELRFFGEFNPFLTLLAIPYFVLNHFGRAFIFYIISYFFVGVIGFFLLCRRIFTEGRLSFLATIIFLFSSVGLGIFSNYTEVLLVVPGIWFFYFFIAFFQEYQKRFFVGMVFSLMIILTTYMPFYFLTIFIIVLFVFTILYFQKSLSASHRCILFLWGNKILVLCCVLGIVLSAVPGLLWLHNTSFGEDYYGNRYYVGLSDQTSVTVEDVILNSGDKELKAVPPVDYELARLSGIAGPVTLTGLFSGLALQKEELAYFFMPVVFYIFILLSLINCITKRSVFWAMISLGALLISMSDVTPVYKFLYHHVYYFSVARNCHFYFYLIVPVLIIFIVEQLGALLNVSLEDKRRKIGFLIFIVLVHAGFLLWLSMLTDVLSISFITTVISGCFWFVYYLTDLKRKKLLVILLLWLIIILQPLVVFSYYMESFPNQRAWNSRYEKRSFPTFFYDRKKITVQQLGPDDDFMPDISYLPRRQFIGNIWAKRLVDNVSPQTVLDYVQYEFLVYDGVNVQSDRISNWNIVEETLSLQNTKALVHSDISEELLSLNKIDAGSKVEIVSEDSGEFEVLDFDINHIKFRTNFKVPKFIVYNDTYQRGWRLTINGEVEKIYRANVAFKGLLLNPGENIVYLRYGSVWLHRFYLMLMMVFMGFFVWCIWLNLNKNDRLDHLDVGSQG